MVQEVTPNELNAYGLLLVKYDTGTNPACEGPVETRDSLKSCGGLLQV